MKLNQSFWIIKARKKLEDGRPGWEWEKYFEAETGASNKIYDWGGADWVKSSISRNYIREGFRKGDLVVCHQVDQRAITGFSRLASDGYPVDGIYSQFHLVPCNSSYRLKQALSVGDLRTTGCKPMGFTVKGRGTIAELTEEEFVGIVAAICAAGTEDEDGFLKWLKQFGVGDGSRPPVRRLAHAEYPEENAALTSDGVDKAIAKLEKRFANQGDTYVRGKISALIRRDGPLIRALKEKYSYKCQFPNCKARIFKNSGGYYCEVAHIQAAAKGGTANRINLLVLCPNHHKSFDYGKVDILLNTKHLLKVKLNDDTIIVRR